MSLTRKFFITVLILFTSILGAAESTKTSLELSRECDLLVSAGLPLTKEMPFAPHVLEVIQAMWSATQFDTRLKTLSPLIAEFDRTLSVSQLLTDPILRLQVVNGMRPIEYKAYTAVFNIIHSRTIGGPQALTLADAQKWLQSAEYLARISDSKIVSWKNVNDAFRDMVTRNAFSGREGYLPFPHKYWIDLFERIQMDFLVPELERDLTSTLPKKIIDPLKALDRFTELIDADPFRDISLALIGATGIAVNVDLILKKAAKLGYSNTDFLMAAKLLHQFHIHKESLRRLNLGPLGTI